MKPVSLHNVRKGMSAPYALSQFLFLFWFHFPTALLYFRGLSVVSFFPLPHARVGHVLVSP